MRTSLGLLLACAAALAPAPAAAAPPGSPFAVDLRVDLPLTLGAAAAGLVPELLKDELAGPACAPLCDPAQVNALDRATLGFRTPGTKTASDVLLWTGVALPYALDLLDVLVSGPGDRATRFGGFGKDVLVLTEVLSLNFLVNNTMKYAVRRPRPLVYNPDVELEARTATDAGLSFYSGHTSTSFAMATAYSFLFMKRHPGSRLVVPVWVISCSMAAVTGYLRIQAGQHFITDVLAGAVAGTAIGLLVPYLHMRPAIPVPGVPGLALRILPMAVPGGAGLALAL
jgi:membrane-associated phospholipid phosphatase